MDHEVSGSVFVIDSDARFSEFRCSSLTADNAQFEVRRTWKILGHRDIQLKSCIPLSQVNPIDDPQLTEILLIKYLFHIAFIWHMILFEAPPLRHGKRGEISMEPGILSAR